MADEALTIKAPKSFGYDESPELKLFNTERAIRHQEESTPLVNALSRSAQPNTTPEQRLQDAQVIKNQKGTEDIRWGDLIQSLSKGDFQGMYVAATGGADVYSDAFDQNGNKFRKVFNQRTDKANPYGEVRRYETTDGKILTPQQVDKLGVIASLKEIPVTQRPFYEANNIMAKDAATAQAKSWNNLQEVAKDAAFTFPELKAITTEQRNILTPLLAKSVNGEVRTLLAGIGDLRTGNTQSFNSSIDRLREFQKGNGTKAQWDDFQKASGGLTLGLNYNEGKGLSNMKGENANESDINRNIATEKSNISSENSINARKDQLMEKAVMLAAGKKIENLDLIQRAINNEFKKSQIIRQIESKGGIGIAKPNSDFAAGDSYSLAFIKNEMDDAYADLGNHLAETVRAKQGTLNGVAPAIGSIESEVARSPYVTDRKKALYSSVVQFEKEFAPIAEEINKQKVSPQLLGQPAISQTNQGSSTSARQPSKPPELVTSNAPQRSRPAPVNAPATQQRSLGSIFGGR
jgi:flavodoxin